MVAIRTPLTPSKWHLSALTSGNPAVCHSAFPSRSQTGCTGLLACAVSSARLNSKFLLAVCTDRARRRTLVPDPAAEAQSWHCWLLQMELLAAPAGLHPLHPLRCAHWGWVSLAIAEQQQGCHSPAVWCLYTMMLKLCDPY